MNQAPAAPGLRVLMLLLAATVALAGCADRDRDIHRSRVYALGTLVELSLYGVDAATAARAETVVSHALVDFERRWSAWGEGPLGQINARLTAGEPVVLPDGMAGPIRRALHLQRRSRGHFNPLIGQLTELWGFHVDAHASERRPPARTAIEALAPLPGADALAVRADRLVPAQALRLDLGGFAKGLAVDQALAALAELDVGDAIINAGGDLRVAGRPGDRRWRIGVRDPRQPGVLASMELDDGESVFTSGDYERYFMHEGRRYHHILDPRTGYPAKGVRAATVIHDDATTADAAATALFVAGPEGLPAVARRMGIRYAMLLDTGGRLHMNPAMAERVRLETDEPPETVLTEPL